LIGKTVSHYRILEKLGEGGMGVVYKAEDTKLRRTVALKFLPPEITRDSDAKARFVHEAQAASALQHNNICTIHEIDETPEGQMFICMDYYDGETLSERIKRGPLPLSEAVDIATNIAAGLAKAHEAGMVHRDIKPANLVVTSDGVVKVVDFGLAKLAGATRVTKTGTTVGTVAYMSPEHARGEEVDHRSDLFSLGAVFYELLTGELPFKGDHEAAVLYGVANNDPPALNTYRDDLPSGLQRVIDKALAKDVDDRYQSALEFNDDIAEFREQTGGISSSHGGARTGQRPRWIAPLVAVAVIAVALAVWQFIPKESGEVEAAEFALAVVDFRDLANPDDLQASAGMTELVNIGLIENSPIRVVSPEYLRDLRRRLFGSGRGPIEDDQVLEVARKAGATLLLAGRMGRVGDEQFVTWRLVDTHTGESVGAQKVEGDKLTLLVDRIVAGVVPIVADVCGVEATIAPTLVDRITTESLQAYEHFIAGVLFEERNLGMEAGEEWEKAIALDSTFALAHLEMGRLYWSTQADLRDADRSQAHLEKADALKTRLGSKDRLRLEAAQYDGQRQVDRSIAAYEKILERWPDDRQALTELMRVRHRYWDLRGAGAMAEKALELYPDQRDSDVRWIYLHMVIAVGRPQDALQFSRDYVKRLPEDSEAWWMMARAWWASGAPDSAEVAVQRAGELDPDYGPLIGLARCAYSAGDLDRAIELTELYLERDDLADSQRRWRMLVKSVDLGLTAYYREGGRYQEMLEVGDEAQQYSGGNPSGWAFDKGTSLLYAGRAQEALAHAEGMLERYPDVRAPFYSLRVRARAMAAVGDLDGARAAVEELYAHQDRFGPQARMLALRVEAEIALAENDPATALEALDEMYELGITIGGLFFAEYFEARARAHRMAGRLDEAAAVHNELLRIYGGHALSHYQLGLIYEEMGRPQDAKREFTKFLEMWSEADEGLPQLVDAQRRLAELVAPGS